jgi:hypothetical protein
MHRIGGNMSNRFLVVPTIGLWKSLATDSSFVFMMNTVRRLIARGNYAYVVLPRDIDMENVPKIPGVMYFVCDVPARALDTQMGIVDQAFISNTFGFQYGKYVVDAGIVLHGSQVLPLKAAVHPRGPFDCFPVFCLEQGVSWIDTAPGYEPGRYDEELMILGASYSYLCCVSKKDLGSSLEKARHFNLSHQQFNILRENAFAGAAPVDVPLMQSIAAETKKNDTTTLLYAARTNKTKHPEDIVEIFDALYKQNEPINITYVTQTSPLKFDVITKRRHLFDERGYIEPRTSCGPMDFYKEAAKSHVYLCWSDSESFNASAVEASLLGCVYMCHDTKPHRDLYDGDLGGDVFWLRDKVDAIEKVRWVIHHYEEAYKMQAPLRQKFLDRQIEGDLSKHIHEKTIEFHRANVKGTPGKLYYYKLAESAELTKIIDGCLSNWADETIGLEDVLVSLESHGDAFSTDNLYRAISRVMPVNWNLHQMMKLHYNLLDTCDSRYPRYRIKND